MIPRWKVRVIFREIQNIAETLIEEKTRDPLTDGELSIAVEYLYAALGHIGNVVDEEKTDAEEKNSEKSSINSKTPKESKGYEDWTDGIFC
jgi:hypothetical protein